MMTLAKPHTVSELPETTVILLITLPGKSDGFFRATCCYLNCIKLSRGVCAGGGWDASNDNNPAMYGTFKDLTRLLWHLLLWASHYFVRHMKLFHTFMLLPMRDHSFSTADLTICF